MRSSHCHRDRYRQGFLSRQLLQRLYDPYQKHPRFHCSWEVTSVGEKIDVFLTPSRIWGHYTELKGWTKALYFQPIGDAVMNSDCSLVGDTCFCDNLYLMIDEEQMLFYKPWNMRSDEERQEVIRIWEEQGRVPNSR
jgi:hypothetical protein